jgi:ribosomal protein S18 acetylase RimI-like enzyme
MRASKVVYKGVPAQGSFIIERPSHGELRHAITVDHAAHDIQRIGFGAWSTGAWAKETAQKYGVTPEVLVAGAFDPASPAKIKRQKERLESSRHLGRRVEYWFGEHLRPFPTDKKPSEIRNLGDYFPTGQPDGFVKIEHQGGSNNRLMRASQMLSRQGLYVCLHDINVIPDKQGKGLGTALAYTGLSDQPRHLKSSLYTAADNEPMRAFAEKYGYYATDEYIDDELFPGVEVPFIRYQANSVHQVLRRMESKNAWLVNGESSSLLGRMMDEQIDEEMSLNPKGF